jgi:ABC-type nitrate/sulfonate/bicarbonate transport system substrate-binding protein
MRTLTVGAVSRNYFNMPLWIARQCGFFEREALAVTIELHEPIDAVTDRLKSGALDLALGVTEHVILDAEAGGRLRILAGNVNRLPFSLIARPGLRAIADLRGGRIGVSSLEAGSSSLVMQMLAAHGLAHPRDYALVAVGPILARWEKLQAGEIDAGLQGVPLNHIARDAGFVVLADPRQQFPDFQFTSLNADMTWAAANREPVVAFLRAFIRAHDWFYANREASLAIAEAEARIERRYAALAWDEFVADTIFPRDAAASPRAIQTLIEVSGLIRALPPRVAARAEDYVDATYLEAARASLAISSGDRAG